MFSNRAPPEQEDLKANIRRRNSGDGDNHDRGDDVQWASSSRSAEIFITSLTIFNQAVCMLSGEEISRDWEQPWFENYKISDHIGYLNQVRDQKLN